MPEQLPQQQPEYLSPEFVEQQKQLLQGLNVSSGFKTEVTEISQINSLEDGSVLSGEYPDPAIQSAIAAENASRELAKKQFQKVVDEENDNHLYGSELRQIRKYFADKGLQISPLRVVSKEVNNAAYAATGKHFKKDVEGEQGRSINGRAIIIEDQETMEIFGAEDYVLSIGLHEAAHSLSQNRLIRTVKQRAGRIALSGFEASGLGKADLRKDTEFSIVGAFWEEAFADLTRVRALRELGRSNDFASGSREVEMSEITFLITANSDNKSGQLKEDGTIVMPAQYAAIAKTSNEHGRNMVALAPSNFAAFALDILDQQVPGLYDDLLRAVQDPKKQAAAIAKINSVKPGLYKQLRDLDYNEKDFADGLRSVMEAVSAATSVGLGAAEA